MPADRGDVSELLGLLYEGLAFPERWPDFLREVARRLRCDKAAIILHDLQNQNGTMGFHVGVSEDAVRDYNAHYGAKNPIVPPILRAAQKNGCWHGLARAVVNEAEYKKSEFYDGWGRKHGVFHNVVGFWGQGRATGTSLSVCRPERNGPLGQDAVDLMGGLVPHLRRAFQVRMRLEALHAFEAGAKASLERFGTAVIAISADGSVVSMNRQAEALLERNDCLTLRQGRLAATNLSQAAEWEQLLRSAVRTGAGLGIGTGGAMLLRREGPSQHHPPVPSSERRRGPQPLPVTVMPFHSSHLLTEDHPCALVLVNDPAEHPASRAGLLSALYRLTPAECRLADLMLGETDLRAAAERMRITINTARFMIKSIFAKTETHRQAQLVRLLMSLPGETQPRR